MTKVAILIPTMRGISPRIQDSLSVMQDYSATQGVETDVYLEQGSLPHVARNELIKKVLNKGYSHVLFVDDDSVVPKDGLIKLLAHQVGVASGLYVTRQEQPSAVAFTLDDLGQAKPLTGWTPGTQLEVEWVGAGFLLIRFDVLKKVAEAYIECKFEVELFGKFPRQPIFLEERLKRFQREGEIEWFRFLPTPIGSTFGEDASFCVQARACGFPTLLDTGVVVGHLGEKVWLPSDMEQLSNKHDEKLMVPLSGEGEDGLWHRIDIMTAEVETLEFLASLVNLLKPKYVVETGSYEGWSTVYMGRAIKKNGRGQLTTCEMDKMLCTKTQERVRMEGLDEVITCWARSSLEMPNVLPIDLFFGDSAIEVRMQELDYFRPMLHKNSLIVVHDIECAPALLDGLKERDWLKVLPLPTPRGLAIAMLK